MVPKYAILVLLHRVKQVLQFPFQYRWQSDLRLPHRVSQHSKTNHTKAAYLSVSVRADCGDRANGPRRASPRDVRYELSALGIVLAMKPLIKYHHY